MWPVVLIHLLQPCGPAEVPATRLHESDIERALILHHDLVVVLENARVSVVDRVVLHGCTHLVFNQVIALILRVVEFHQLPAASAQNARILGPLLSVTRLLQELMIVGLVRHDT